MQETCQFTGDYSRAVLHTNRNFVLILEVKLPVQVQLRDLTERMRRVLTPVLVAVLTKGQVCDSLIAGNAVTNVAAGLDIRLLCLLCAV